MNSEAPTLKLTLLLIEDNPGDARLMRELLADGAAGAFELEHAERLATGRQRLLQGGVALVLLDLSLPDSLGLETFTQTQACAPHVPIIVLSGRDDEALAINTVHEGAQDYLVKGQVDSRLLVRAVRYAIERKRAEEALAQERDLLHTLLDNLADEQRVMQTGRSIIGKVERETLPDGRATWALTSKLPLKDRQGNIIGNFGISRDITALKHIEEELAAERNLLRNLIDHLPDYIYVKDAQGRFQVDNVAHRRLLGASTSGEIVGRTAADFFPPEAAARFSAADQSILQTGQPLINDEAPLVDQLGNSRWHLTTKLPLRDGDGHIVGLVGISRDITEQKLAGEKLQQANADLARSKAELEAVLADLRKSHEELKAAQFQLIQAEKMQSVGRLAAGVAHEVKNPLAILGMGIEYLSANLPSPDPNVALILNDMKEAIRRADLIILGLLDFSVPRALDLHAEDLSAVIEQSLALVRHELTAVPITLVKELAEKLPAIWLDKNKVKQVFVNILTNATHAM